MAGLKELRSRISSVKSTEKITSAMKMVAASRLRRAQDVLLKNKDYRQTLYNTITSVMCRMHTLSAEKGLPVKEHGLCLPKSENKKYLLVILSSDKGLCGSYNSSIGKVAMARIEQLKAEGKEVQLITLGARGYNMLKRNYKNLIVRNAESVVNQGVNYCEAEALADEIIGMFNDNKIDVCEVVYSHFKSALSRDVKSEKVLPFDIDYVKTNANDMFGNAGYIIEPDCESLLETLIPLAFKEFIFDIMINSQASEQGARMTSMDNATRNAGDMISKLTLRYNRLRQGAITTELTEIIAGAEAV